MKDDYFEYDSRHFVIINKKKYEYQLEKITEGVTYLKCKAARIDRAYSNEDLPEVLMGLPKLIKEPKKGMSELINFRVTEEERKLIEELADEKALSVSEYIREMTISDKVDRSMMDQW